MKPLTAKLSQEANAVQPSVQTEYWDTGLGAAGCIFVAKDTGRILIAHRNAEEDDQMGYVEEPDTWATWGGKIDEGESPKDAVVREVEEETGYTGNYKLAFLWTYEDKSEDFQYHNFLAIVDFEFLPERSWENDRGKWVEWGEWPHPMHFGLKALLQHAGEKIHRVVTLIKRKKADIVSEMDAPPAIVQPASATANYNITNAYIVAATLWGEARGEGEKGMQAVMNVIMNRVKGDFKKAKGVALAYHQFSMWNDVTDPEATALVTAKQHREDKQWQQAVRIVDLATSGKLPDITGGATFYFNPKKANPSWAKKMVKTVSIGHHDFYKPRKMVKKKMPEAIREMIESQDPHQAILFKKGLAGDGIWEYELKSPRSYLRYRHEPDTKIFYLDNIGTPNREDKNKGYAKALLETFFQLIKGQGGALDSGTYTTSGNAFIKHVVERLSTQYGVRLVKGRDPICESGFTKESAVDKSVERGKLSEAYGDPGDHVVFGGVFYPERVVANVVNSHDSYFGHTRDHGPTRWVYYQGMKTVFWHHYPPSVPEWEVIVKEWLEHRGYPVERQTDKEQYYKLMAWYQKKGLLKEMEDSGVILGALDKNGSNLQPVYSKDQLTRHPPYMEVSDRRWRYYPELEQLDWQGQPTPEEHEGTKEFLAQRGLMVKQVHYLAGSTKTAGK